MTAKIGESLKRIVEVVREPGGGHGGEFALSNRNRLAAYQAILGLVMARPGTVSNLSGLKRKSALWHISGLSRAGFVDRWDFGRAAYYSPAAAVADDRAAGLLKLASGKLETGILWASTVKPGSSTAHFSKLSIAGLAGAGLVLMIGDGNVNRLYPGVGLKDISEKLELGYAAHKSLLVKLCRESNVRYQATPLKDGSLDFNVTAQSGDYDFAIPAKPFENSLTRRAKLYNFL